MPQVRELWAGPPGSAVLGERVWRRAAAEAVGLCGIVPSPLARDQAIRALAVRCRAARGLRVWCWDDLWREARVGRDDAPALLSASGVRAVLREAIDRARRAGLLGRVGSIAEAPGFRRRLRGRIAAWTSPVRNFLSEYALKKAARSSGRRRARMPTARRLLITVSARFA